MSEGGEGLNVTTGVAMRDPRMGEDRSPIKRKPVAEFEKEIKAAVAQSGKDKVHKILVENVNLRDEVRIDGMPGKVVGKFTLGGVKQISVDHGGKHTNYVEGETKIEVVRHASQKNTVADHHLKDALIGKRQGQMGRYHTGMANYYTNMADHFDHEGDPTEAAALRIKAEESRATAKEKFEHAAKHPPVFKPTSIYTPRTAGGKIGRTKTFYAVPFAKKDEAKKWGFRWDQTAKSWYHVDAISVEGVYPEQSPEWNATLRKNHGFDIYRA